MNLLRKIFDWVSELPAWQQDAARRLYEKPSGLSESDYQELCRLALKENGLESEEDLESIPMDSARIQQNTSNHTLILKSLGNLRHVNKIAPSQKIIFLPTGITVVYGNNGTGKSGYARVFKRACFCRDVGEEILPDVEREDEKGSIATATFEVEYDGVCKQIEWRDGCFRPELANIAVFDSKSARVVLDSEQEPHYIPYGLDILITLGSLVLPRVKQDIERKRKTLDLSMEHFAILKGDTVVGRLFSDLPNTRIEAVRALAILTPQDLDREQYLLKFLADNNYNARINENNRAIKRFSSIVDDIKLVIGALDDDRVRTWQQVFDRWRIAKDAEALAARNLRSGEVLLEGTGGGAWKLMFLKAQDFVVSSCHTVLSITDSTKCPLCQQDMGPKVRARIRRFAEYVKDKISIELQLCEEEKAKVDNKISAIAEEVIKSRITLDEIEHFAVGAIEQYKRFVTTCAQRKAAIRNALVGNSWNDIPVISKEILETILGITIRLKQENSDMQRAMEESNFVNLEKEFIELHARHQLNQMLKSVEAWFERKALKERLDNVLHSITTATITNKVKEFAATAISEPLRLAIDTEFNSLGIGSMRLRPSLVTKGRKGKFLTGLELGVANQCPIGAVLSEGEQKVIAIASFMAELTISEHKDAIVFDDPMTSLDHMYRRKIATRLAQEALNRQVIVFSHEPTFITVLIDQCLRVGAKSSVMSLTWGGEACGLVMPGMPWEHSNYKTRIQELRKLQSSLASTICNYPSDKDVAEIRKFYGRLRATIELVAQEECLRGTVRRFNDKINMAKLKEVPPLNAEAIEDLYDLFGRCSDVFDGHDHSSEANEPVPMPNEMLIDIERLESIIRRVKDTRKKKSQPPLNDIIFSVGESK